MVSVDCYQPRRTRFDPTNYDSVSFQRIFFGVAEDAGNRGIIENKKKENYSKEKRKTEGSGPQFRGDPKNLPKKRNEGKMFGGKKNEEKIFGEKNFQETT